MNMEHCPQCDKQLKYMNIHLKNTHGWNSEQIKQLKSSKIAHVTKSPIHPRNKLPEATIKAIAKRDAETMIVRAFTHINSNLSFEFIELHKNMNRIFLEAEPARDKEINGVDIAKKVHALLSPACEYLHEAVTHEMFLVNDKLKNEIEQL